MLSQPRLSCSETHDGQVGEETRSDEGLGSPKGRCRDVGVSSGSWSGEEEENRDRIVLLRFIRPGSGNFSTEVDGSVKP